jgi:hypothetical protein
LLGKGGVERKKIVPARLLKAIRAVHTRKTRITGTIGIITIGKTIREVDRVVKATMEKEHINPDRRSVII